MIPTALIYECLKECDFILLQEIFPSETSKYADILLPGVSFAEKTGTYTNTERRVQMVNKAIEPLGDSKPDWLITAELAKKILSKGNREIIDAPFSGWDYDNSSQIMDEIASLTPSYAGVTHQRLLAGERLQWPVKSIDDPGTPILHIEKFSRGRGKFFAIDHVPPAELPDEEYPMLLSTGRVLYHWHGGEMTRRSKGLLEIYDQALVEMNPMDAKDLGINGKKRVRITSRRGKIESKVWITDRVPQGMIFANFHFPNASANELTIDALDPVAKIPEYKVCAVKIELA